MFLLIIFRDLAELTEKLNSIIKKELRRRSDIQNLRGFVDDDDQIGHLLAKHYDLESDQNSIVPVVQKKRICESVQDDISSKNETEMKLLQKQTDMLNGIISNIDGNLRNGLNRNIVAYAFVSLPRRGIIDQTEKSVRYHVLLSA